MNKTLLHTCCAPCSITCIDQLREDGIELVSYWNNPNIHPWTEYRQRRDAWVAYTKSVGVKRIQEGDYGIRPFTAAVASHPDARCGYCYSVRLEAAASCAAANGFSMGDRIGVKLGFAFPAGVEVSRLAAQCSDEIRPKSSVKGMTCSLSGLENQCAKLLAEGKSPEYVCKYCLLCIGDAVVKMTKAAQKLYPDLPVVCAGGVMSSDVIRSYVTARLPGVTFVPGKFSSDNAIGTALLAGREVAFYG